MKKKIISLLLVTMISSTILISCGKTAPTEDSKSNESTTEQTSSADPTTTDSTNKDSSIIGENNKSTVKVTQIGTTADFKDKDKAAIEKLLGKPLSEDDAKSVYEKDSYTFEINYSDSKCKQIKIIPKEEMKYPAEGTNILKIIGIDANQSDSISPAGLEWNDKFDVSKIKVVSNNDPDGKIAFVEIIF